MHPASEQENLQKRQWRLKKQLLIYIICRLLKVQLVRIELPKKSFHYLLQLVQKSLTTPTWSLFLQKYVRSIRKMLQQVAKTWST